MTAIRSTRATRADWRPDPVQLTANNTYEQAMAQGSHFVTVAPMTQIEVTNVWNNAGLELYTDKFYELTSSGVDRLTADKNAISYMFTAHSARYSGYQSISADSLFKAGLFNATRQWIRENQGEKLSIFAAMMYGMPAVNPEAFEWARRGRLNRQIPCQACRAVSPRPAKTTSGSVPDFTSAQFYEMPKLLASPRPPLAADFYQRISASLPNFDGKITSGTLVTYEGQVIGLQSSNTAPALINYPAAGHVEGKAAIYIGITNSVGGIVFHNNPSGTCNLCYTNTPTLLTPNASLIIMPPSGAIAPNLKWYDYPVVRIGNSREPKLRKE